MGQLVRGDGWSMVLPGGSAGGPLQHTHTHLRSMSLYRGLAEDGSDLEAIVTTYPGDPIGEHGERLDEGGDIWTMPGARVARRRDQQTRLDMDPDVPPVETIIIVATAYSGESVCLVLHRPLHAPASASESVARSFALAAVSADSETQ